MTTAFRLRPNRTTAIERETINVFRETKEMKGGARTTKKLCKDISFRMIFLTTAIAPHRDHSRGHPRGQQTHAKRTQIQFVLPQVRQGIILVACLAGTSPKGLRMMAEDTNAFTMNTATNRDCSWRCGELPNPNVAIMRTGRAYVTHINGRLDGRPLVSRTGLGMTVHIENQSLNHGKRAHIQSGTHMLNAHLPHNETAMTATAPGALIVSMEVAAKVNRTYSAYTSVKTRGGIKEGTGHVGHRSGRTNPFTTVGTVQIRCRTKIVIQARMTDRLTKTEVRVGHRHRSHIVRSLVPHSSTASRAELTMHHYLRLLTTEAFAVLHRTGVGGLLFHLLMTDSSIDQWAIRRSRDWKSRLDIGTVRLLRLIAHHRQITKACTRGRRNPTVVEIPTDRVGTCSPRKDGRSPISSGNHISHGRAPLSFQTTRAT